MYNLASSEYDIPVELSQDEVNEYMGCLPDGIKSNEIKIALRDSLSGVVGAFADISKYEIIWTQGRESGISILLRILADTFMHYSDPKFLMPYAILMQNIPVSIASIFENEVAMKRLKTLYIPTTLQGNWTCRDFLKQYLNGNVILLYASLCTEFGWMFSHEELCILSEACSNHGIPLVLDISHLLISSKVLFDLIPDNFPILIGDFKYGFGPVGLGFLIISKKLIEGWKIKESIKERFNDIIFPLLPFIAYKSISISPILQLNKEELDAKHWELRKIFIDIINSCNDLSICSHDNKDIWSKHKTPFSCILLLDPNSNFCASGYISFFIIARSTSGSVKIIDGDLLQNKLMNNFPQIFLARCNPLKGYIYTHTKHVFMRGIEYDEALEQTLICSLCDINIDDMPIIVNNIIKVIRLFA